MDGWKTSFLLKWALFRGYVSFGEGTVPETNSKFAPENGWLEYDPFLLGPGNFSRAVKLQGV